MTEEGAYTRFDRLGPDDLADVPVPGIPDTTIELTDLLVGAGLPANDEVATSRHGPFAPKGAPTGAIP